jgi:hypothetical protein
VSDRLPPPEIGQWYCDSRGERFEVVATDGTADLIEVQYFDGTIEEFDGESWLALAVQPIGAPEDWSGPYDDLVADDMGDTERAWHPEDYNDPFDSIEARDWDN